LKNRTIFASGINWIGIDKPEAPLEASAKIRYHDKESPCTIEPLDDNRATVSFREPKNAVATGQAVVFYRDDEVLGGGTITEVFHS